MWPAAASPKLEPGITADLLGSRKAQANFSQSGSIGADVEHDVHAALGAAHGDVVQAAHRLEEDLAPRRVERGDLLDAVVVLQRLDRRAARRNR